MDKEIKDFNGLLYDSWLNFLENLPAIAMAILVFLIGFFIIKYVSKIATNLIEKKSDDPLVSDFLVNIISFILMLFLIVICMSILGWGSITDKILAGAGISTFVIGFALKDIGENFLAGILMAFKKPFRVGDLIEVEGIKGKVARMSLRETNIKTLDGKDVFVPNGLILKNPLQNYTLDNYLRNDFLIGLDYDDDVETVLAIIEETVKSFSEIEKTPAPSVYIEELAASTVNVRVMYWIQTADMTVPSSKLKSRIMLKVYKTVLQKGYKLPADILEVKLDQPVPQSKTN
ncbi:mechanosensitive ion channel family protein [Riemerella columbina]|uniref:mechanosensitive ion channel family protein n=1 Tax=Riemerella columbina TaxID=103810 RepID=UPI00266F4DFE|nr:mechanosensitive ion channel family protein [Riemerella columbina]WKS94756.1 mechanosensitive ion channel family protein [Riemerella columbina]